MKKPPIPTFVAAYPEPKKGSNFLLALFLVLVVAAVFYYFYTSKQKNEN